MLETLTEAGSGHQPVTIAADLLAASLQSREPASPGLR